MKTIGITGGVGAGKSLILEYIEKQYNAKIYLADDIANELKLSGHPCFEPIVDLLGEDVLENGEINKFKMAEKIFSNKELLTKVNEIIHPAVRTYIMDEIQKQNESQNIDLFILEAALLIEEHYDEVLDELWYIHTDRDIRIQRLKESRNYSDEKINNIMKSQLSDEEYKNHCKVTIYNNTNREDVYKQIDANLEDILSGRR